MKHLFFIVITLAFFAGTQQSCKKGKSNNPQPNQPKRIKSISDAGDKKTFSYDNENRLTRIDFNGGSFRIAYSSPEITAQVYFANGNPDPSWKYLFTKQNNRINGGFRYLPNGGIGRDYRYEYDIDGRLSLTIMRLRDFTGEVTESHRYNFSYDAENNLQQVKYTRENRSGVVMQKADSVSATISYYNSKNFIKWKQTGFDFFGKVTAGIQLTGLEIIPFSFLFQENIVPNEKAIQAIDTKRFVWNQGSNSWGLTSSNNQNHPETFYEHNNEGLVVKYKNIAIEWEAY